MLSNIQIDGLSGEEREAVRLAMEYWSESWDWECQTLFGIDFVEFDQVLGQWPDIEKEYEEIAALAVTGSLRELLMGASAQSRSAIQEVIGLTDSRAASLLEKLNKK